jgi:MFS transporter, DHA2 family, multidrug resistance protein
LEATDQKSKSMSEGKAQGSSAAIEGLPPGRRGMAALALALGLMLAVLDATMINVALPSLAESLNASAASVVWVVNAYSLAIAMTLLPMAAIGERIGFKRLFYYGLWAFIFGALASALAPNLPVLLLSRIFQGLGGSAIMCLFGALVRHIYPPSLMGRGIGLNALTVAVSSVMGPSIGAYILSVGTWHWIFLFSVPMGLLTLMCVRYLPDVAPVESRFDWQAAILSMTAIGLFIIGIDYLIGAFWHGVALIAIAALIGMVLVRFSSKQTAPLVPVDLFRIPAMRYALAASASTFAAQMAMLVSLPFYLQITLERSQLSVGFLMAAWPAGAAVIALIAGRLSDRFSVALLSGIGACSMAIGLVGVVIMPSSINDWWLFFAMLVSGVGFGFFQTPNNRVLIGSAPRHRAGALGGLQATTRVFSQTFGAAIVSLVFSLGLVSGPLFGLLVAIVFSMLAVLVNIMRHFKAPHTGRSG